MDATEPDARSVLRAAQTIGWYIGIPLYDVAHRRWKLFAYDTNNRYDSSAPRQRTAVGSTEEECVREMARSLRDLS